jgi:hypothetical protein
MTQLVELRTVLPQLRAAGYEPFAISNDTVERLAAFSERNDITYPLLSDEDSTVIRRFGIMNTLIKPGEGKEMRWYGIPYPGTYITDAAGVIVDKDFHQHHARRASGRLLVHRVTGTVPEAGDESVRVRAAADGPEVSIEAYLLDDALRLEVLTTLVCRIRIRKGLHLYAEGSPEAFIAARLAVSGDGIRVDEPRWPTPGTIDMPLMDEQAVPVWEDEVIVTVPVTATSELIKLGHGLDTDQASLTVSLDFQACDDQACLMPQTVTMTLTSPLATLIEPEGIKTYVSRLQSEDPDQ